MSALEHIVRVSRHAASIGDTGPLSTGSLAAAIVLNRADWLADMGYTMTEASRASAVIGSRNLRQPASPSKKMPVAQIVADGIAKARVRPEPGWRPRSRRRSTMTRSWSRMGRRLGIATST